jgi:hypoxanthine phosphoribosyltransferase
MVATTPTVKENQYICCPFMSELISIKDKTFKPFITADKIANEIQRLAGRINEELKKEFPLFIVVLNGSFMFASDLLKEVKIPCEVSFVKLASYNGTKSSGTVKELIGLNEDLNGRTVVVVEDIVDSGRTLEKLMTILKEKNVKQVKVATILLKSDSYTGEHAIDFVAFSVGNDFVVGYGLDYEGLGRNLKEIYVLA